MGMLITFFVLSITGFYYANSAKTQQHKVLLSVYYESLCPDSKKFILKHLLPVMQQMHEYVRVKLVPFGKAKSIEYGFGGFACQHGQKECFGNMLQDCTLHHMSDRSDLDKVKYVACEMDTRAGANNDYKCVKTANVPVQLVQQCILEGKGSLLQLDSEYMTQEVTGPPWPAFIPTVTASMKFNKDFQKYALDDLFGTLCSKLTEAKPCATLYNQMVLRHLFHRSTLRTLETTSISHFID